MRLGSSGCASNIDQHQFGHKAPHPPRPGRSVFLFGSLSFAIFFFCVHMGVSVDRWSVPTKMASTEVRRPTTLPTFCRQLRRRFKVNHFVGQPCTLIHGSVRCNRCIRQRPLSLSDSSIPTSALDNPVNAHTRKRASVCGGAQLSFRTVVSAVDALLIQKHAREPQPNLVVNVREKPR